jgi:F-type H+-transporting ATPase subunit epsilon
MAETLQLEVVTPTHRVLAGRASEVRIPGVLGELGVLPGHTPLLTSLGTGELKWTDGPTVGRLVVQGGFAEVQPNAVTVLATLAEAPDQVDLEAARAAREAALEKLKTASADEFDELDAALRLAEVRVLVASGGSA